jgi:parallel beta-helix repeat protein
MMPKLRDLSPLAVSSTSVKLRGWPTALLCLLLLLGGAAAARAQMIIYVPCDQSSNPPCPEQIHTINSGIAVSAQAGGQGALILVAPGSYAESINFPSWPLTIKCNGAPGSCTIEANYYPFAVNFGIGAGRSSILDGFTISYAGDPYGPYEIITPGPVTYTTHRATGGISVTGGSSPTIINNTISYNACGGIVSVDSYPLIQNNVISNAYFPEDNVLGTCFEGTWSTRPPPLPDYPNYGFPSTPIWLGFSGDTPPTMPAIVSGNTIEKNAFYSNQSNLPVGTINVYFDDYTSESASFYDYSPFPPDSPPTPYSSPYLANQPWEYNSPWQETYYVIENNIVRNNTTNGYGGGMVIAAPGIVAQNQIYGNSAGMQGGGVLILGPSFYEDDKVINAPWDGPPAELFINNMVGYNTSSVGGSQIEVADPTQLEFANNIIVGDDTNSAVYIDPGYFPLYFDFQYGGGSPIGSYAPGVELTDVAFDHNDIYNSVGPAFNGNGIISNPAGSNGSISADPLFVNGNVDPTKADYHLQAGSPAIDAGNNSALQQLANLSYPLATDFSLNGNGNPRVQDDTGVGYPIVDMGPYESAGAQQPSSTTLLLTPSWWTPYGLTELPLTAQLNSPTGTPTGTVTFYINCIGSVVNCAPFGTATIDSTGKASILTPHLAQGQTTLTATYAGNNSFSPAASVPVLVFVWPDNVTFTFTSSQNPSLAGNPVTFTANLVSSSNGTPNGQVQFTLDSNPPVFVDIDSNGNASFTADSLTRGYHTVTADYPGTIDFGGGLATIQQHVTYPAVTQTLTSSLPTSARFQPITLTTIISSPYATPTGSVDFTDGSSNDLGTVQVTTTSTGVVTASLTTTNVFAGKRTITATYSGDNNFSSNAVSIIQNVIGFLSTTTLNPITPAKLYVSEQATITAQVTGLDGAPTNTVTFTDNGAIIGAPATLNGSGIATLTYAFPAAGSHTIVANYNGDDNYNTSSSAASTVNVLINDSETTLVVTPAQVLTYHPITLTATTTSQSAATFGVVPDGSISFLDNGASLGTATLASGVAGITNVFTQLGLQSLVASYPGNAAFLPSQSSAQLIFVIPTPTATVITSSLNPQEIGSPVTFTATVSADAATTITPPGTVTFYDGTNSLGTFTLSAAGTAALTTSALTIGQHSITATYTSSTTAFLPSASPVLNENIVAALGDFSISVAPSAMALYAGQVTQNVNVVLTSSGGWDRTVTLSCGKIPPGLTCNFSQTTIPNASGSAQLIIQTTAPHPTSASSKENPAHWPNNSGMALAALALILIPFRRVNRRLRRILSAFVLAALLTVMNGCGAPSDTGGTPQGVYTFQVSATYSDYGVTLTHSADFNLTVKPLF